MKCISYGPTVLLIGSGRIVSESFKKKNSLQICNLLPLKPNGGHRWTEIQPVQQELDTFLSICGHYS